MIATLSQTEKAALSVLRAFLLSILADGSALYTGSIAGTELTVTDVQDGSIAVGDAVIAPGIAPGTIILEFGTGNGAEGTYVVNISQTVASSFISCGLEVVKGQVSRVPEPSSDSYVVMTPVRRERIETDIDEFTDALFTGSIAGDQMTITDVVRGALLVGSFIFGVDVLDSSKVIAFGSGAGDIGTYTLNKAQTLDARPLSAGTKNVLQPVDLVVQIDVHGSLASDMSQRITTLFRNEFATSFFADNSTGLTPLYADDMPKQVPFLNAEDEFEDRWTFEVHIEMDACVGVPQQFADEAKVQIINVEAAYPLS